MFGNKRNDRLRGHKVKLYPNENQKTELERNMEVARAVYNIGLYKQKLNELEGNPVISKNDMEKIFRDMRNNNHEYSWLNEVSFDIIKKALGDLDVAFYKYNKGLANYPKFKTKKEATKSFAVRSERTHVKESCISLSGLSKDNKLIDAKNHNIPNQKLYNTRVSYDGYNYWFTACTEREIKDMSDIPKSDPIGVDVGIRNMIVTSDGDFYSYSDTTKLEKKLKRQQRKLSKDYNKYLAEAVRTKTKYEDVSKSKNHYKRLRKMHKTQSKITNKRKNDMNVATKEIVNKNPSVIVIEDISVKDILRKEPWMKKYTPQMAFHEIHRQIQYKAEDRNIPVIKADRNFASTKICSNCGFIHNTIGSNKTFKCPSCGFVIDRDLNAAINLKSLAHIDNEIVYSIEC